MAIDTTSPRFCFFAAEDVHDEAGRYLLAKVIEGQPGFRRLSSPVFDILEDALNIARRQNAALNLTHEDVAVIMVSAFKAQEEKK